ncbi:MAG TPA: ergothioneine biosynthesis protein EgtB [Candidatus Koribacter sp.]|jgi:ergothioneine biosynthesis protein EgtB
MRISATDSEVIAEGLLRQYREVRAATERLVAHLSPEDLMLQPMADASPAKWHLAHTTWFFETFLLSEFLPGYTEFDPDFRTVFNSYYKGIGKHPLRTTRGGFSRPTLDRVLAYRAHVDAAMQLLITNAPPQACDLIVLGLNHEQQHQELIVTDIKFAFWSQPLQPAYAEQNRARSLASDDQLSWSTFDGGTFEIGHSGSAFSFDNELPRHAVLLQPFRLANRLSTNREYVAFIEDDGYRRAELWLSDGWDTVKQQGWEAPLYWETDGNHWQLFTAAGLQPLDLDEPVCHLSFYEADAFARWSNARLPLESEWEHAAQSLPIAGNFAESGLFHPAASPRSNGLQQVFGDVWEWTASPYVGYPGFHPAPGAVGEYNGKFMCNQLVLRGGSCATPQSHIRASYRNFFPPHARWQFMGVRLASDAR